MDAFMWRATHTSSLNFPNSAAEASYRLYGSTANITIPALEVFFSSESSGLGICKAVTFLIWWPFWQLLSQIGNRKGPDPYNNLAYISLLVWNDQNCDLSGTKVHTYAVPKVRSRIRCLMFSFLNKICSDKFLFTSIPLFHCIETNHWYVWYSRFTNATSIELSFQDRILTTYWMQDTRIPMVNSTCRAEQSKRLPLTPSWRFTTIAMTLPAF